MIAKTAENAAPMVPRAHGDFYVQIVHQFPLGMALLHLSDPSRRASWKTIAANARARRLLGANFDKRLKVLISNLGELAKKPIDVTGAIRDAFDQHQSILLGHISEQTKMQPADVYAVHALPLEQNYVAIVLHDVSTDVQANRDRAKAETRLEQICRSARAILWTADPTTLEFRSVTREARSILGYWVERWRSEPNFWHNHAHPDDWELIQSRCSQIGVNGSVEQLDFRMYDVEEKIHWFRLHLSMGRSSAGQPELSGVMVDITDEKRNEQAARELSAQVMRAQERERKRISRDLHDSVGQYLTGLHFGLAKMKRQSYEGAELRSKLDECIRSVQVCMEELRAVSYALHPPAIEMLGLAPAMEWQAKRFAEQSSMQVNMDAVEKIERMDGDREIALFRVFQECLSNVRRHAKTDEVLVRLRQESGAVILEVADNGVGVPNDVFEDLSRGRRGIGLLKMRERLTELGGALEVRSGGKGTTVRARLPHGKTSETVQSKPSPAAAGNSAGCKGEPR